MHPKVLGMKFKKSVKRAEISNGIDNYVGDTVGKVFSKVLVFEMVSFSVL